MHRPSSRSVLSAVALALSIPSALADEPWTLDAALARALAANPDGGIARSRISAAAAALARSRSAFHPRVSLGGGYLSTDRPSRAFGIILDQEEFDSALDFNDVPTVDDLDLHARVSLSLYRGGTRVAAREQAQARSTAAREGERAVRHGIERELGRVFFTVRKSRAFVEAAAAAVRAFDADLQVAQRRLDSGTGLRTDVLDIEVRRARAQEELVRARNAHALARQALRSLLALEEPAPDVDDAEYALEIPAAAAVPRRADLSAAAAERRASAAALRGARGGGRPRVEAFGSFEHHRGWELDGSGHGYSAGVELSWDVWDGRRTRAEILAAQADLDAASERERKLRLAVELEVATARLGLAEADARIEVTRREVDLAAESVALTRARYEEGLELTARLIQAETALTAARMRRAEAEADRQIAIADLRVALGLPLRGSETENR